MSKNLFNIPPAIAGKVLSFLNGGESLLFYSIYGLINKVLDFIPRDYCFVIEGSDLEMWSGVKHIRNLYIINPTDETHLNGRKHLESFGLETYPTRIIGLERLNELKSLDIGLGCSNFVDLISNHKKLEHYVGKLEVRGDEKQPLNLISFSGSINTRATSSLFLDKYFNPDTLEELKLDICHEKNYLFSW